MISPLLGMWELPDSQFPRTPFLRAYLAEERCSNESDDWARELFSLFSPDPVGIGCQRTPDRKSHIAPTDLQATLLGQTRAAIPPSGIY